MSSLGYIPEPTDSSHTKGKKISKKDLKAEIGGVSYVPSGDIGEITSAPATYDLRIFLRKKARWRAFHPAGVVGLLPLTVQWNPNSSLVSVRFL